jgi:MYXO-CTERM domain-containing protein
MTPLHRWTASLLCVGALALAPLSSAEACGGCFAPPNTIQTVTDHRMVISLSAEQSVLWDQFRYSGRPEDFSWILPIRDGNQVRIELAENQFLSALDNLTAPILNTPPRPASFCSDGFRLASSDSAGAAPPSAFNDAGVSVLREEVVGPYATVTLRSTDPMALRNWLRDNGYVVPAPVGPVIDYYVQQRMDFVALRLRPNEGIDRMQPVRVITPGMNPTLPLRMISAGIADKVGLLLMVIASSRYEAQNFPNGEISNQNLTFDFDNPTVPANDFRAAFDAINRANGNRAWVTESSFRMSRFTLENAVLFGSTPGVPQPTPANADDVRLAFSPLGETATVTRLRADLGVSNLDRDLILAASTRPDRDRTYAYGRVRNTPPDPCVGPIAEYQGCSTGGTSSSPLGAVLVAGVALAAFVSRRRRR